MTIKRAIQRGTYWFKAWQEACERERGWAVKARVLVVDLTKAKKRVSVLEEKIQNLMDETAIDGGLTL